MVDLGWYSRPAARRWRCAAPDEAALAFHAGLPGYRPTPLVELPALAIELGVGRVLVKDESSRLGLPAFKVLGASWAVARLLTERAGPDGSAGSVWPDGSAAPGGPAGPGGLDELRELVAADPVTLVTATDGNHGRAVARMASLLGARAHVVVPDVLSEPAAEAIAAEGATVERVPGGYDDAVRHAASWAQHRPDAELVQDMAWPGYQRIPAWIVEGYSTLMLELDAELADLGILSPDLVVVPVGVGSLAQAVVAHCRSRPAASPAVLAVEPDTAACALASLQAGEPLTVPTAATVMAGLNCGTPSSAAWPYLRDGLDAAVAVGDQDAICAVDDLAALGVSAGPSGAATLAGARAALTGSDATTRREALGVGRDAVVVLLNTEAAPH